MCKYHTKYPVKRWMMKAIKKEDKLYIQTFR